MSNVPEKQNELDQLKQALAALKKARTRLDSIEKLQKEPIAIIGMGCRFPGGANSPKTFWELLKSGTDAITTVPEDRWDVDALYDSDPAAPGKMTSRWGGFIDRIDQFDAGFFGISPREAAQMDPQQRLVLEVAWEALEDAGLTKAAIAGTRTGVYVGAHSQSSDYLQYQFGDAQAIDIYTGTGTAHSVLAGRLAYLLDLRGPTMTVDTACSSSLVTVHLACQSLRLGESEMAVVAGVNLMLTPEFTIAESKMHMLAPDGHCKAFDSRADGFVRGEGCGVIVLKRLSDAVAAGDHILGLIRGTAINQDGHTNGLTAPNGLSQQQVIKHALENAGVQPAEIGYIEAHGTGTALGDVIEVESLAATVGATGQSTDACYLGSVKTNIGHLEGAAGIAGLIKAVLILRNQSIPPVVHFKTLNPNLSLKDTRLKVPASLEAWKTEQKRLAGVSSFGWSGTNAHIILEEAPETPAQTESTASDERAFVLPLSAQSKTSLESLARSYSEYLSSDSQTGIKDIAYTASLRRTHHEYRLAVTGSTPHELAEQLDCFLKGETGKGIATGQATAEYSPRIAFVFPGQGSQWIGMGRELFAKEPVFRESILESEKAIRLYSDWSLIEQLQGSEENSRINEIDVIQPTLFAIQVALAALWRAWGVNPDAVIGHSMGEIAAAHVAGALDLQNAARIICIRSKLLRRVSGQGVMAVIGLSLEQAQEAVGKYQDQISIAVSNSPRSTVVSGDPTAMQKLFDELESKNIFCRLVKVDVASHSPQMDPLLGDLVAELEGLEFKTADLPLYSTVTGKVSDGLAFDTSYWADNLRKPVLFSRMVEKLLADDHTIFIEISPHPILLSAVDETLHHINKPGYTFASLLRNESEQATMLGSLGKLFTIGYDVDWKKQHPTGGRLADLPKYAWDHQRHWIKSAAAARSGSKQMLVAGEESHPLLGVRLPALAHLPATYVWQAQVGAPLRKYVKEHQIENVIEAMAYAAAGSVLDEKTHLVSDLRVEKPFDLAQSGERSLQFVLTKVDERTASFKAYEQTSAPAWDKLAEGKVDLGQADLRWFYKLEWQKSALQEKEAFKAQTGNWLVFCDETGLGKELADLLATNGTAVLQARRGENYRVSGREYTLNPADAEHFGQVFSDAGRLRGILYLWGLDVNEPDDAQALTVDGLLLLMQSLLKHAPDSQPRIWAVTRGAQPVDSSTVNVPQSLLWGFGRSAVLEHPELWGGLIDLGPGTMHQEDAQKILAELSGESAEKQVGYRGAERYVPRLMRDDVHRASTGNVRIHADATYLITGGLGGLGLKLADWLADQGAKHIVLTSRSGLHSDDGTKAAAIQKIESQGVSVVVVNADASNAAAMTELFQTIRSSHPPLRGIFHLAGREDGTPIQDMTVELVTDVLASKVSGSWNIHKLADELDFLVSFSSASAIWGSKGLAHYAASNHFMDALAYHRQGQEQRTLSVNWGWWESGSMGSGDLGKLFSDVGLTPMPAEQGFEAMYYLLRTGATQAVVADVDWNTFKPIYEAREQQPLLEHIVAGQQMAAETSAQGADNAFAKGLRSLTGNKREEALLAHVRAEVADVLGLDSADKLDIAQGFFKLGMDSITTVRLRSRLENSLDCTLPPTVAFEYPSVESLTGFLLQELFDSASVPQEQVINETAGASESENTARLKNLSDDELFALLDDEISGVDKLTKGK